MPDLTEYVALIDHKNVAASRILPVDILTKWISSVPISPNSIHDVTVRTYGGWYSEGTFSDERANAIAYYQTYLPSLFSLNGRYFRVHLQFADSLVRPDKGMVSPRFTHTSATRPSEMLTQLRRTAAKCGVPTCKLNDVKRWINRKKACLEAGCPNEYTTYFERREQKQVDVHIAADLLVLSAEPREIALVTADTDFVPAVAAFAHNCRGGHLTWIRPNAEISYIDTTLPDLGINVIVL